jgi:hypothetical protein
MPEDDGDDARRTEEVDDPVARRGRSRHDPIEPGASLSLGHPMAITYSRSPAGSTMAAEDRGRMTT